MPANAVSQDYLRKLGQCRPLRRENPPQNTFEIGLVLGGAVSAGAYSAGVVDFLVEALDAWYAAKSNEAGEDTKTWNIPGHDVSIRVIAGASAGAMVGAIMGPALRYPFPHQAMGKPTPEPPGNPLYDAWVQQVDIKGFLGLGDLAGESNQLISFFDTTSLQQICNSALNYGKGLSPVQRPYIADPLKLMFTLTNLRGVPFVMSMLGNTGKGFSMTLYEDSLRFALQGLGSPQSQSRKCPDEHPLSFPNDAGSQEWHDFGQAALASGAFPVFLRPRALERPLSDYDYLFLPIFGPGPAQVARIRPTWPPGVTDPYQFLTVDGGALNNQPLELARRELAGLIGRNPREGQEACRALILIDPFPDPSDLGPEGIAQGVILKVLFSLLGALIGQARCKIEDLLLADDETIYSRFMVAPDRGKGSEQSNGFAIAGGALGGFSGFLCKEFREHDYYLGRRNCQKFLWEHFSLPEDNPLFAGWNPGLRKNYYCPDCQQPHLPIIPLMGSLKPRPAGGQTEPLPVWPKGAFSYGSIEGLVNQRLEGLYPLAVKQLDLGLLKRAALRFFWFFSKGWRTSMIKGAIMRELKARNLDRDG